MNESNGEFLVGYDNILPRDETCFLNPETRSSS